MALYLEGKVTVDAKNLSPKEATAMSRDIKYIGMDVHKEAIVIAVLNASGKLVMESIVETQASSILQFMHGLQGELHVTWEVRNLGGLVVRSAAAARARSSGLQSTAQCLIKGRQQERQGGCAQTGRVAARRHAATGLPRKEWAADATRVGAQLSDHQPRLNPSDESAEGPVSRLGHCLCGHPGLCRALSGGVVEQDSASRGAPPRGVALSTAGWIAGLAAKPAPRIPGREPET